MVSIHSHEMTGEDKERPAQFLQTFAKACIDAGASVVLGHGPHILRGIELYKGGIISTAWATSCLKMTPPLISLLIFTRNTTCPTPAWWARAWITGARTAPSAWREPGRWRSVIAQWDVEGGKATALRLYPIHLGMELPRYRRGLPAFAEDDELLAHLAELSAPFGTRIDIVDHVGIVRL